jgi:hypothetical protein
MGRAYPQVAILTASARIRLPGAENLVISSVLGEVSGSWLVQALDGAGEIELARFGFSHLARPAYTTMVGHQDAKSFWVPIGMSVQELRS